MIFKDMLSFFEESVSWLFTIFSTSCVDWIKKKKQMLSEKKENINVQKIKEKQMSPERRTIIKILQNNFSCSICLEIMKKPTGLKNCGHVYCIRCLLKWILRGKNVCPLCRSHCTMLSPIRLYKLESIIAMIKMKNFVSPMTNLRENRSHLSDNERRIITNVLEELKCFVCHSLLKQPIGLECGHIFCEECIQNCIRSQQNICPMTNCKFNMVYIEKCELLDYIIQEVTNTLQVSPTLPPNIPLLLSYVHFTKASLVDTPSTTGPIRRRRSIQVLTRRLL